jgi:hypothetical protein
MIPQGSYAGMKVPPDYWREGESLIDWVEEVFNATKVCGFLEELPPSPGYERAYEAEICFLPERSDLSGRGHLWLRAHQEIGGVIIVTLFLGRMVIRRAHIGGGYQEPTGGPFIEGPHIHYSTAVFSDISGRGRSRSYEWDVPHSMSLHATIEMFLQHMNIRLEVL